MANGMVQIDPPNAHVVGLAAEEIAHAAARIEDGGGDASAPSSGYLLRDDQTRVFRDFASFLMDVATRPATAAEDAFGRIILPPRTGKTVIAGHIIARTGLRSTFIVPTKTLVVQTARELRTLMPNTPVGVYFGEQKELVEAGVNVATYSILLRDHARGGLPDPIASSALVFADEAHRAMTPDRMDLLHHGFPEHAVRVALTATPDYDDQRVLCRFFPRLIHEVTLEEAFALDLLAPARVWVAEIDAEGSRVRILAGDYEEATLGRVMSSAPFSRAVEVFRYGDGNAQLPALIACTSRQQASDLREYLGRHRPAGAAPPEIVLGETTAADRARILGGFDAGTIDTLIQVGVLLEGWNSPRCKLLLDLAPTLSRVRATQKYFRVMTKHGAAEARIYVLVPKDLPELPILPMELFGASLRDYECGELLGRADDAGGGETAVDVTKGTPIAGVTLKKRIVFTGRLEAPQLERGDVAGLRAVLRTSREFDPNLPCNLYSFNLASFAHPLFTGRGRSLLRWLGVPPTTAGYAAFLARAFPDGAASQLLGASEPADLASCREDAAWLRQGLPRAPNDPQRRASNGVDDGFAEGWRALTGFDGLDRERSPDPLALLLEQERADKIAYLLNALPIRKRHVLVRRFGLYGQAPETSERIARDWRRSSSLIGQIEARALGTLRSWVSPKDPDLELRITSPRRETLPPF
ncbi:MAG TPA: DEAD/DEAH box helicase family protein, partial [Polyangiaceae bacterium]